MNIKKSIDNQWENLPLNLILYGPPGTGKTHKIQNEYMPLFTDKMEIKTKSEYLEKELEEMRWMDAIILALMDNEKMEVSDIFASEIIQIRLKFSNVKRPTQLIWALLQTHTKEDCPDVNVSKRSAPYVFWKDVVFSEKRKRASFWSVDKELVKEELPELYKIWEGINSFKPVETEEKRYDFITFHQSFSYEDFIEGIKPKLGQSEDDEIESEGDISYKIEQGIFLKIANKAEIYPDKKWALFIDEINRGNVATIFGELITLIEENKRGELSAKLPYSKENFKVPKNLYIIGTMNTADKSIEALDAALRRRFSFIEVVPEPELLSQSEVSVEGIDLEKMLKIINKRVGVFLDKDHLIGHSYFMKIVNKSNPLKEIKKIFANNLIPLFEEYFYGDRSKIKMILGPKFVKEESIEDTDFFSIKNIGNEVAYEKNYTYEIIIPETLADFRSIYEKSHPSI